MDSHMTLAEITSEDYRSAVVFKKYKMDFCCGGKKTLEDACKERKVNVDDIIQELKTNSSTLRPEENYGDWRIDFLADYIVNTQHSYVRKTMPEIQQFLLKTVSKHSENHPELLQIQELVIQVSQELLSHMQKEEQILFPYIKNLRDCEDKNKVLTPPMFGSIKNPIEMMEQEHEEAGTIFETIRELSNDLVPPTDACKTYQITYKLLNEFEENLHFHVHLENNILFPKAINLETELL